MGLNNKQFSILQTERVSSILSLAGCGFILVTYCSSSSFRKPIRTLIFYASFGNILSAVASLIARDGIEAGQDSVLCQLQAFFIQQWMPADSLWSLCMALNIYFALYKRYSLADLKSLELRYFVACYGVPLIPSITLLRVKTNNGGRIYGPATIWCSIDDQWLYLRIVCFYGPVWLVIIASFAIYVFLGRDILQKRRALRHLNADSPFHHLTANKQRNSNTSTAQVELSSPKRQLSEEDAMNSPTRLEKKPGPYSIHIETAEQSQQHGSTATEINMDVAIWSYLRCSFLFLVALVVTWIPSSVNRIYSLIHPDATNFGLNLVGCFVLPLQGFWNAIIYFSTSFSICKELWSFYISSRLRWNRVSGVQNIPLCERRVRHEIWHTEYSVFVRG